MREIMRCVLRMAYRFFDGGRGGCLLLHYGSGECAATGEEQGGGEDGGEEGALGIEDRSHD